MDGEVTFEQQLIEKGFESTTEYNGMVMEASIHTGTPEDMELIKHWQHHDGTKEGLQKLIFQFKRGTA